MERMFRNLKADEIECRVGTVSKEGKGLSLLLYKDARCDMNILDETVGALNWQRTHSRDNQNCTVSIWSEKTQQWVSKEDTGTESNTEAEKGLASDSFKRACTNWGIGRELYTAPFIWVKPEDGGKYDKFLVKSIAITDGKITQLTIVNRKTSRVVFTYGCAKPSSEPAKKSGRDRLIEAVTAYAALVGEKRGDILQAIKEMYNYSDTEEFYSMMADEYEQVLVTMKASR